MARAQVLVVDDRESVLELMASILGEAYEVTTTPDPRAAVSFLEQRPFDVVLTDVRMPGMTGFDLLAAARRCGADASVVMMTGFASIRDAVGAIRNGAFDYVAKPLEADEIALVVARAVEHRRSRTDGAAYAAYAADADFHGAIAAARDRASRDYLVALMREFHGNVTGAAHKAGVTRESLHRLLKKYGVHSGEFKPPAH
jgi:DNA-binding NtrC family response regulator